MLLIIPSQHLVAALEKHDLIPSVISAGFYPSIDLDVVFAGGKSFRRERN
jgi:hypothetical protein